MENKKKMSDINVETSLVKQSEQIHSRKPYSRKQLFDESILVLFLLVLGVFTVVILFGDTFFLPKDATDWCRAAQRGYKAPIKQYSNIDAIRDPCYYENTIYLLGFSMFDCDFGRRMICAVVLGAAIGWERKKADRPAGIRTMSLVCLGAAIFTMGGQFAFRSSTMGWDASRVSAAIPSGVGFLGSALIWKETIGEGVNRKNSVHGITTAASIWLAASIGIGVGGALYVMSIWTVVLVIVVLRLGPALVISDDNDNESEDVNENELVDIVKDWNKNFSSSQSLGTLGSSSAPRRIDEEKEDGYPQPESAQLSSIFNGMDQSQHDTPNRLTRRSLRNSIRSQQPKFED